MSEKEGPSKVEILSSVRLLDSYMSVDEVRFRTELVDGGMSAVLDREVVNRSDTGAALVRHEETGNVILIRQFRLPVHQETGDGWVVEIPAGIIEAGERPEDAVRREVREETGYEIAGLSPIGSFFASPGYTTEQLFLFDVTVAGEPQANLGEADEDIERLEMSPQEALKLLAEGAVNDAKTLIALHWMRQREGKK